MWSLSKKKASLKRILQPPMRGSVKRSTDLEPSYCTHLQLSVGTTGAAILCRHPAWGGGDCRLGCSHPSVCALSCSTCWLQAVHHFSLYCSVRCQSCSQRIQSLWYQTAGAFKLEQSGVYFHSTALANRCSLSMTFAVKRRMRWMSAWRLPAELNDNKPANAILSSILKSPCSQEKLNSHGSYIHNSSRYLCSSTT